MLIPNGLRSRLPRSRWARLVLVLAVLAAGAAAGAYAVLVLSTINAPASARLSAPPSLAVGASRSPSASTCARPVVSGTSLEGAQGAWVVAGGGGGGFVGYRAAEILALDWIRSPNDAVGRSTAVTGSLEIDGSRLTAATIEADLHDLRSDQELRDGHIAEYLRIETYPRATFTLSEPIDLGEIVRGQVADVVAHGDLALLNASHPVEFPLHGRWNGDTVQVAGQLEIRRSDWNMDVPQLLGFRVSEEITIELELLFVRPAADPCGPAPTVAPGGPTPPATASPPSVPPVQVAELDAWPKRFGEIAFVAYLDDPFHGSVPGEIYVLRAGSAGPIRITASGGGFVDDPAWNRDGTRLAYARYPYDQPPTIWGVAPDGKSAAEISANSLRRPSWSPDGRYLVAIPADEIDNRIMRVDVATGVSETLLNDPGVEDTPSYSPDGSRIIFTLLAEGGTDEDLYVMDPDGSNLTRLTSDPAYEYAPAWSPDGLRVAFIRSGDLWVMRADGSDSRRLTSGVIADAPTWSPNGRHIAFVVTAGGVMTADDSRRFLWLVDVDGSNLSRIGLDVFLVARPAWRPSAR